MSRTVAAARGGRVERLPSPLTLDQFELGVTLGTGSFGRVRFVVHKVSLQGGSLLHSLARMMSVLEGLEDVSGQYVNEVVYI